MSSKIYFESYTDTNSIGLFHKENQDSILASETDLLFAIADGVGGYLGAKEASKLAINSIKESSQFLKSENALVSCAIEIDRKIKESSKQLRYASMGTTIALAKILPERNQVITANVGDSPILLISDSITTLYTDDSMRYEDPRDMWSINQYLGCEEARLKVHTRLTNYKTGDTLLLCSDGVSDNILRSTKNLSKLGEAVRSLKHAEALVKSAIDIGFKNDDMSAILVFL